MDKTGLFLLLAFVCVVRSHDYRAGVPNGVKIYDENVVANPALWKQVQNVTIRTNGSDVISGLIVTDMRPDKDGDIQIVEGGEGQKNVTLQLKSPTVLRGFEFHIEVYAVSNNFDENVQTQDFNVPANVVPNFEPTKINQDMTTKLPEPSTKLPGLSTNSPHPVDVSTDIKVNDSVRKVRQLEKAPVSTSTSTTPKALDSTTPTIPAFNGKDEVSHQHHNHGRHNNPTTTKPDNKHDITNPNFGNAEVPPKPEDEKTVISPNDDKIIVNRMDENNKFPLFPVHNDKTETKTDTVRDTRNTNQDKDNKTAATPSQQEEHKAVPVVPSLFRGIVDDSTTGKPTSPVASSTVSAASSKSTSTTSKPQENKESNEPGCSACGVKDIAIIKTL